MQYIKGTGISFEYGGETEPLLTDVSFEINKDNKIGLVGRNGCGKTTLLKIMTGEYKPVKGKLYLKSRIKIGFLPQETIINEEVKGTDFLWQSRPDLYLYKKKLDQIENLNNSEDLDIFSKFEDSGGYLFENTFEKTLSKFEFNENILERTISSLSGGEKTKMSLCQIVLKEPDILLLDEPTNHLDLATLSWLENYLRKLHIPFVVISHDRTFLDNCVSCIWELDSGALKTYAFNYSFYKYEKETEYKRNLHLFENQQKKIKQLKKTAIDRKKWADTHQPKTGKNGYAPVYESITNHARKAAKRAKNIDKRIEMMVEKEEAKKPILERKSIITFNSEGIKNKNILAIEDLKKSFENIVVFENLHLKVPNGTRLAVVGKNGSGKSTFFKIITGKISSDDGSYLWAPQTKIGYYSQEHETLNQDNTILDEVLQGKCLEQTNARIILGRLNICKDKVYQEIKSLSIGERSKVALAKIIVSESNVLVLDEPVNHLEILAREALEEALLAFTGTILFVSHDRYFQEKIATDVFDMDKHISF
jgi:ATP-binding cassette subfamily F protein 3